MSDFAALDDSELYEELKDKMEKSQDSEIQYIRDFYKKYKMFSPSQREKLTKWIQSM